MSKFFGIFQKNGAGQEKQTKSSNRISTLLKKPATSGPENAASTNGGPDAKPEAAGAGAVVAAAAAPSVGPRNDEPSTSQLVALAQKIAADAQRLEAHLKQEGLPMPGFGVDAPEEFPKLPEDVARTRLDIINGTKELRELVMGPRESVRWNVWKYHNVVALQLVNHFQIAKLFPTDSTITLADLQTKTTLDPINLARAIRLAITDRIFAEPAPGVIAHTAASRLLASDEDLQAWIGFNAEDILPASAHVLDALRDHPAATDPKRAGFQYAFGTAGAEPMFATLGRDPARARRMGRAMASLTGGEGYELSYLVDASGAGGYDFSEVDARAGTLVDVGGSIGFVCVELARRYRNMKFVVQDLPRTIDSAPRPICGDDAQVAARIELMPHDFFTEQTVQGADVYFFRWIMHNYSTPYAAKILRALVPALRPGARILINDHCLREGGAGWPENDWDEWVMRCMDMVMLALLNAQERTEAEYRALFAAAHEGFVLKRVIRPKGCRMSIIEAVWKPDEVDKTDAAAAAPAPAPAQPAAEPVKEVEEA